MLGLIGTVIAGFVVGLIAKLIMPGRENRGFVMPPCSASSAHCGQPTLGNERLVPRADQGAGRIDFIVGAFVLLWGYMKAESEP